MSAAGAVVSVALGSCSKTRTEQRAWRLLSLGEYRPDAFAWMGDVVYTDVKGKFGGEQRILSEYEWQANHSPYRRFAKEVGTIVGTWDDHDFHSNNGAGTEVPPDELAFSRNAHLRFFGDAPSSTRWKRRGVYNARYLAYDREEGRVVDLGDGEEGGAPPRPPNAQVVQLLLTDIRTALDRARADPLGDEQWAWLERHLAQPADVRVVVSSIQVLANTAVLVSPLPHETWAAFPRARRRLLSLVGNSTGAAVLMSGDVHMAETIALPPRCVPEMRGRATVEFTSSGMTHTLGDMVDRKLLFGFPPLTYLHHTLFPGRRGGLLSAGLPRHFKQRPRAIVRNVALLKIDFDKGELVAKTLSLEDEDGDDPAILAWTSSLRALTAHNEEAARHVATLPSHRDVDAPCFEDELGVFPRNQVRALMALYVIVVLVCPVLTAAWTIRRLVRRRARRGKRE